MTFDEFGKVLLGIQRSEGIAAADRWLSEVRVNDPDPEIRDYAAILWTGRAIQTAACNLAVVRDAVEEAYQRLQDSDARAGAVLALLSISTVSLDGDRMQRYAALAREVVKSPDVFHWRGRIFLALCSQARAYRNYKAAEEFAKLANDYHRRPAYGPYDKADRLANLNLGLVALGEIYLETNRLPQAVALLSKLPPEPNGSIGQAYKLRGKVALAQEDWGMFEKAMADIVLELERNPNEILRLQAMELRIRAGLLTGKKEETAKLIDEAEGLAIAQNHQAVLVEIQAHRLKLKEVSV